MNKFKFIALIALAFGTMIYAKPPTSSLNPFDKSKEAEDGLAKIAITLPDSEIRIYAQCKPGGVLAVARKKGKNLNFSSVSCDSMLNAQWN